MTMDRKELERLAWRAKHPDYKGKSDGVRSMLYLNPKTGATELWPLSKIPDEELKRVARIKEWTMHEDETPMTPCAQCGKPMNPAERMLGPVCGKCARENQKRVTGGGRKEHVESIVENLLGEMASIRNVGSNQTVLVKPNGDEIFFSYNTPVAAHIGGKFYKTDKRWSVTTSKHVGQYLHGANAETKPQEFFDALD
jgi:hypothetical protein